MKRTKIAVVGLGKLANAILSADLSFQTGELIAWEWFDKSSDEQAILIHAGSGRQLQECVEFCRRTGSVLVELSTGLETETMHPAFPLIICPNTSILVLKTMQMLRLSGSQFSNYTISFTESHQAAKTTEPGTAYALANSLSFPVDKIVSVRNPNVQQNELAIPAEYLDKHAYHKIVITDGNDQVTIETKVLGHDSYAKGVKVIVESVLKHKFENKRYSVLDLIESRLL